jgi:phosphinothricin acetyltransferase
MMEIRAARSEDIREIFEIYNEAVLHSAATFDLEPRTEAQQERWFEEHWQRYPVVVAVEGNAIIGWSSLSRWSDKKAYDGTAEISLYIRDRWRGRGIGGGLTKAVLEKGKENGLHAVVARIAEPNRASMRILESLGFERIGVMREVGRKFGKLLDVTLMQKILAEKGE